MQTAQIPVPTVFVIDDEPAIGHLVADLVRSVGLRVEMFESGAEFLAALPADATGCVVLDLHMPELTGLDVQTELRRRRSALPIILTTGFPDVPPAVRGLREGAFDLVEKPFSVHYLLEHIQRALRADAERRAAETTRHELERRFGRLSPREREVLLLLVDGDTTQQIATRLNVSAKTVAVHRGNVMRKMAAASLASLVRMVVGFGGLESWDGAFGVAGFPEVSSGVAPTRERVVSNVQMPH